MESMKVAKGTSEHPALLAGIPHAPETLYIKGNNSLLVLPGIAIVGTRKASSQGLEYARKLAQDLAQAGLVIISGLAQGIDGEAHKGALDAGGSTIAVLASSLEERYWFPRAHKALAQSILESNGALVSEYAHGQPARKGQFIARNRIVSGLAVGVVVVESLTKGGSLITARFAREQGRLVFGVPGFPLFPNAKGPNELIKQGAYLIESARDVLTILAKEHLFVPHKQRTLFIQEGIIALTPEERNILDALASGANNIDKLAQKTKVEVGNLMALLMAMEVKGLIKENAGRYLPINTH